MLQSLEGRGVASDEGKAVVVQALSQDPATLTHAISTFNTIKVHTSHLWTQLCPVVVLDSTNDLCTDVLT